MKKLILFSKDFTMCYSMLMYLKEYYKVSLTTDTEQIIMLIKDYDYDLVLIDMEPSNELEKLCIDLKRADFSVPIAVIYSYKPKDKEFDINLRKYADLIFYKPFDIKEITRELSFLTGSYVKEGES